jgi:hypothetical protein
MACADDTVIRLEEELDRRVEGLVVTATVRR